MFLNKQPDFIILSVNNLHILDTENIWFINTVFVIKLKE